MTDEIIPEDIGQFLLQAIDSVAQLEGLLLLQADRQRGWSAEEISHELYVSASDASLLLGALVERGLVVASEENAQMRYRYQPKTPELEEITDRLASLYRKFLVPVSNLIHSKPKTRIQEFANAFRIRKD